jgi:ATP-binding cassette subfamily F protein 3
VALSLEGIGKRYGERQVLSGLELSLDSGERLVVAGRNGAGKSTLLRIIAGADKDYQGTVKHGSGINAGYFSQDAAEAMQGNEQILELLEAEAPAVLMPKLRDMLGAFLFRGDDVYKPLSVLSGGEKSRLALLRMLLKPMNLLILDEPTNHLDLYSKDILLDTLSRFAGTIIFVSHDRAFMEALSTKTLELSAAPDPNTPSQVRLFYGNYGYYLERVGNNEQCTISNEQRNSSNCSLLIDNCRPSSTPYSPLPTPTANEKRILDKQQQSLIRRLKRQEEEILKSLEELEKEKQQLEAELARPEVYAVGEKAKAVKQKLDRCAQVIEVKTAEWEKLVRELSEVME